MSSLQSILPDIHQGNVYRPPTFYALIDYVTPAISSNLHFVPLTNSFLVCYQGNFARGRDVPALLASHLHNYNILRIQATDEHYLVQPYLSVIAA